MLEHWHSSSVDNPGGEHSSSLDDLCCRVHEDLGGAERLEHSSRSMLERGSGTDDKRFEHSSSSKLEHGSCIDNRLRAKLEV